MGNADLPKTTFWYPIKHGHILVVRPSIEDARVQPLEINGIGIISTEDFQLRADGGWTPEGGSPFEQVYATASITPGFFPEITALWSSMMEGWKRLRNLICTPRAVVEDQVLVNNCFKIRHLIFRVRTESFAEIHELT